MAQQFKSRVEFEKAIKNKMADALDEVYDHLLDKLIEIIKRDVYDAYSPKWYERTYDLLDKNNWAIKRNERGTKYLNWSIYFKGENLTEPLGGGWAEAETTIWLDEFNVMHTYDPKYFTHGNPQEVFEADNFLKMLNGDIPQGYGVGWLPFPTINRRPFWDDFLDYCEHWYPILFKNACKRNGIPLE